MNDNIKIKAVVIICIISFLLFVLYNNLDNKKMNYNDVYIINEDNLDDWTSYSRKIKSGEYKGAVNILVIGDSSTAGFGASNPEETGFIKLLEKTLIDEFGFAGEGIKHSIITDPNSNGKYLYNGNWEKSWDNINGLANSAMYSKHDGDTVTWEFKGEYLGVIFGQHREYESGEAILTIDDSINTFIKINELKDVGYVYMLDGLERDVIHEAKLEIVTKDQEAVVLNGTYSLQRGKGVIVNNCSLSGATSKMWVNSYTESLISFLKPKLTIICLGGNDWNVGGSKESYYNNIKWLVDKAKAQGDILLISYGIFSSDHTPHSSQKTSILEFRNTLRELAIEEKVAYLDIIGLWKDSNYYANLKGYLADNVHANDKGQKNIYILLREILL